MSYIIRQSKLEADPDHALPAGFRLVQYITGVNKGVTITQAALDIIIPAGSAIKASLIACYDSASVPYPHQGVGAPPSIVVSIEARYGEHSQVVCLEYYGLLELFVGSFPDGFDSIAGVLAVVDDWDPSRNPRHRDLDDD